MELLGRSSVWSRFRLKWVSPVWFFICLCQLLLGVASQDYVSCKFVSLLFPDNAANGIKISNCIIGKSLWILRVHFFSYTEPKKRQLDFPVFPCDLCMEQTFWMQADDVIISLRVTEIRLACFSFFAVLEEGTQLLWILVFPCSWLSKAGALTRLKVLLWESNGITNICGVQGLVPPWRKQSVNGSCSWSPHFWSEETQIQKDSLMALPDRAHPYCTCRHYPPPRIPLVGPLVHIWVHLPAFA